MAAARESPFALVSVPGPGVHRVAWRSLGDILHIVAHILEERPGAWDPSPDRMMPVFPLEGEMVLCPLILLVRSKQAKAAAESQWESSRTDFPARVQDWDAAHPAILPHMPTTYNFLLSGPLSPTGRKREPQHGCCPGPQAVVGGPWPTVSMSLQSAFVYLWSQVGFKTWYRL